MLAFRKGEGPVLERIEDHTGIARLDASSAALVARPRGNQIAAPGGQEDGDKPRSGHRPPAADLGATRAPCGAGESLARGHRVEAISER